METYSTNSTNSTNSTTSTTSTTSTKVEKKLNFSIAQLKEQVEQQKALARVIQRIRKSLDLDTIFQTTVKEVRNLLHSDRAAVFRFYPKNNWEGEFVSEDVASSWDSVIEARVYDHCFGEQFAVHYFQGRIQAVTDIYSAGLSKCHAEILAKFQVRANLVVPLLREKELWGLLCIHQCGDVREWKKSEIEFVKLIGEHLTVAIQQAEHLNKVKSQGAKLVQGAQRDEVIAQIIEKIRLSLDIDDIFKTTTQDVRELIQVDRVAIFRFNPDWSGDFIAESFGKDFNPLVGVQPTINDTYLQKTQGGRYVRNQTFSVDDIYQVGLTDCHVALLEEFGAKAFATAPIFQGDRLWGVIAAYQNISSRLWLQYEIDLLAQVGTQIGVALRHHEILTKTQERVNQQKALTNALIRIRKSLDLDTIFQVTVTEVRQMLKADRVAVFRFDSQKDYQGKFIYENVVEGFNSVFTEKYYNYCFGEAHHKGEIESFIDIKKAQLSERYQQILSKLQVKASLVIPLFKQGKLWGSLCIHQCSHSRNWEPVEIESVKQISDDLAVALQHNELLTEAQNQAQQQKELTSAIVQIRSSLDLETIFTTTVKEVRQLLKADRVGIFRFDADNNWEGEFIHEDVGQGFSSAIAEKVYDHCFSENFAPLYTQGRVNAIADIYQQDFKDCYVQILERFQVRANIVAPLLKEGELWGLLCIHQCSGPREWEFFEIEFVSQIADELAVAFKHDAYLKQVQSNLDFINENLPKTLNSMEDEVDRISQIMMSLRNFCRTDETELKSVDIHQVLDNTLLTLEHRCKKSENFPGIKIIKKYDQLPSIEGYPNELSQVFMSIFNNNIDSLEKKFAAIQQKYQNLSTECPQIPLYIWIKTQEKANQVRIEVTDNGLGIAESLREYIFDSQLTNEKANQPTGKGLPISHRIVTVKHKGQMNYSSKLRQGTEFVIEIPVKQVL